MCQSGSPAGDVTEWKPVVGFASFGWQVLELYRHRVVCMLGTHGTMMLNIQKRFAELKNRGVCNSSQVMQPYIQAGARHGEHLVSEFLFEYNPQQLAGNKTGTSAINSCRIVCPAL